MSALMLMRSIYVEKFILLIQLAQFELLRVDSEPIGQIASFLSRHCRMINWPNVQLIRKTDLFEALASDLFHKRFKNENPPDKRGPRARNQAHVDGSGCLTSAEG